LARQGAAVAVHGAHQAEAGFITGAHIRVDAGLLARIAVALPGT
jgi:hypothetical protein